MSDLVLRIAEPSDARAIFELLLNMFDEGEMPILDPRRAALEIERVIVKEAAWVVHEGDRLVATSGLAMGDVFWFSAEDQIVTRWFYALPDHRGASGAWGLLKQAAKDLAQDTGVRAWIDVHNPEKTRRAGRLQQGFARFSFEPRGSRLSLTPSQEAF